LPIWVGEPPGTPDLHRWRPADPVPYLVEKTVIKDDPAPKLGRAIGCCGACQSPG
jgi:hypothetical protein